MTRRTSATHLALAYEAQIRLAWHAMHANRRAGRVEAAAYCRDHLATLLVIRSNARRDYVSAPNPSTVAWRAAER